MSDQDKVIFEKWLDEEKLKAAKNRDESALSALCESDREKQRYKKMAKEWWEREVLCGTNLGAIWPEPKEKN